MRPGQRVSVATLRLLSSRQRWDTGNPAVRTALKMLQNDEETLDYLTESPGLGATMFRSANGAVYLRRLKEAEKKTVLVDVSNLVWSFNASAPRVEPLGALFSCLRRYEVTRVYAVADANLPYVVGDPARIPGVAEMADRWEYAQTGTPADELIVQYARSGTAWILTNDRFREWRKLDRWTRQNLWRLLIPVVFLPPDGCDLGVVGEELLLRQ